MKTQTKSRALLLVCVLVLAMALTAVFAFSASAADVTELTDYSLILTDGVDIKVNGTVAEADLEKDIKVVATCYGETTYDVTVEDGAFSVVIPVSVTRYADTVQVDLVVGDEIVATENVSIKDYIAATLADEDASDALKQLVSEIAYYGASVLNKLGYTEDAEAFVADLDLYDTIEPEWEPDFSYNKGVAADIAINKVSMELADRINLIFTTDKPVDGYIVEADLYDVEVDGNTIKVVGIPVSAFFTPITVGVYDGESAVSNEVTMSPVAYIMQYIGGLMEKYESPSDLPADEFNNMMVAQCITMYACAAHEATTHKIVEAFETVPTCQAAGLKTYACEGCGHYEEEPLAIDPAIHTELSYTVANNNITYTCADCEKTWTSTKMALGDGTSTTGFEGNDSNKGFVGGTTLPAIVDGHYEMVKGETPAESQAQFYLASGLNANAATNRLGFVSISLQATDAALQGKGAPWALKLCNSSGKWNNNKGQAKGMDILTGVAEDGSKAATMGGVIIDLAEDGFTRIDISFVPVENDMYLLTYYVDGVAVDAVVVDNILFNYTPNKLYFTCGGVAYDAEADAQPAIKFDDLTLAFTDATASDFFPKNHVHVAGTEIEKIDDNNHGVKCQGCDVFVGTVAHNFDFAGATCGGEATGTCACGATTTKVIDCTLVATGIADNVVTYECKNCHKAYTMAANKAFDCSEKPGFNIGDFDTETSGVIDGAYKFSASQTAANGNAIICAYPGISGATSMIVGFDIKNTTDRGGYFRIQFRTPPNNWVFNSVTDLQLEIKPDGSIYFGQTHGDTGLKISTTEFTSIIMKATYTEAEGKTTLTTELWVNGQYVGASSVTQNGTGFTWTDGANGGAQICLQNKVGANTVIFDNIYTAPVIGNGTDITTYLTAK